MNVPIKGSKHDTLASDRRRPGDAVPAERQNPALQARARNQALRRLLPLSGADSNLDNGWNASNLEACEQAKTLWTQATSQARGRRRRRTRSTLHATRMPSRPPNWPTQSLAELIERTFTGRMIDGEDHPGLLRLIGAQQIVVSENFSTIVVGDFEYEIEAGATSERAVHGGARAG